MNPLESSQPGYYNLVEYEVHGSTYFGLQYNCPCGCGSPDWLPLCRHEKQTHEWLWDGNKAMPTLSPSIRRLGGCRFHGYLEAGAWRSCGDGAPVSPQVYRGGPTHPIEPPRRHRMAEPTPAPTPPAAPATGPVTAPESPIGWMKTHVLQFIDGVLHQRHDAVHPGQEPQQVWVAVPGAGDLLKDLQAAWDGLHKRIEVLEAELAALKKPPAS